MENLKTLRNKQGISQQKLADAMGVSRSTIAMWETGKSEPDNNSIIHLADFFDVSTDELLGKSQESSNPSNRPGPGWIPVKGIVRAGIPIDAVDDILDWEQLDEHMAASGQYIGLRVVGDSMEPRFKAGDTVIVKMQPDLDSGDIGVVMINGDTATIKKVVKSESGIMLIASNPNYEPRWITNEEIAALPVRVLGKVVELRAKF